MTIERLQSRLLHLQRLSVALASAVSQKEAIDAALDHGMAVFGADNAVVALLDKAADEFETVALRGYPKDLARTWGRFPNSDRFPLPEAVQLGRPVVVGGPKQLVERYPDLAGTERSHRSALCAAGAAAGVRTSPSDEVAEDLVGTIGSDEGTPQVAKGGRSVDPSQDAADLRGHALQVPDRHLPERSLEDHQEEHRQSDHQQEAADE